MLNKVNLKPGDSIYYEHNSEILSNSTTERLNNLNDTVYPNCIYNETDIEPSIRGRKIYVPLNIWFALNSKLAFPLISLQYEKLNIEVTCRPVQELFIVRYQPTREIAQKFSDLEVIIKTNTEHLITKE